MDLYGNILYKKINEKDKRREWMEASVKRTEEVFSTVTCFG